MSGIYLETNAIRKLTKYKCGGEVFTSVFTLFELISGINNEKEFLSRKACLKRIMEQKIAIKIKMVDQILCEFNGVKGYRKEFCETLCAVAEKIIKLNSFEDFKKLEITFTNYNSIIYEHKVSVLSWLQPWDEQISNIRKHSRLLFSEDKDIIKKEFKADGLKGIANYYLEKYGKSKFDERRLASLAAFCSENNENKVREAINYMFSMYNYKLFFIAQAVVFAKAECIDGGTQDKNNASDLLHLLYLEKGDLLVTDDKIYCTIAKAIDDFSYIEIGDKKSLSELIKI